MYVYRLFHLHVLTINDKFGTIKRVRFVPFYIFKREVTKMIAEQLKKELNKRDMTLSDLADKVEIPYETLRNLYYSRVNNPTLSTVLSICDALDVTVDYMLNRCPYSIEEAELIQNFRDCGNHGKNFIKTTACLEAQISRVQRKSDKKHIIPCLIPVTYITDGFIYNSSSIEHIETTSKNSYLAIELNTNNFAPTYCKNDRIVLENRFPMDGEVAVFLFENKEYLRTFVQENNTYILKSLNKRDPDIVLDRMDEYYCLGTCIDIIRC